MRRMKCTSGRFWVKKLMVLVIGQSTPLAAAALARCRTQPRELHFMRCMQLCTSSRTNLHNQDVQIRSA